MREKQITTDIDVWTLRLRLSMLLFETKSNKIFLKVY